jgi:hypothetical protein
MNEKQSQSCLLFEQLLKLEFLEVQAQKNRSTIYFRVLQTIITRSVDISGSICPSQNEQAILEIHRPIAEC